MDSGHLFPLISREWRSRIGESHEYAIIKNDSVFRSGLHDRWVSESLHAQVKDLLHSVLATWEGFSLDEIFHGYECDTYEGTCYCIPSTTPVHLRCMEKRALQSAILSDLTLVYGIGRRKERELKSRGYSTIADLTGHRRYGRAARHAMEIITGSDVRAIEKLISRWVSPSHPLSLHTAGFYRQSDLIFIDIETLGLFTRPIILFGIAKIHSGDLHISQYLLRDIGEEVPALSALMEELDAERVIISYNGKAFDIPCIAGRAAFYGKPVTIRNSHYDLLHFSRRRWRDDLPDCRLVTIEQHLLGICRDDDIPGAMVPEFYESYLTTGNAGPLVPIVTHNRQDLLSLARLFTLLQEGMSP